MNYIKTITNGILKENPTFVLLLGMCPTLATTTSAINGLSMGLATMSVLICTNFVISCIKNITPDKVRIPVFIVVIAAFVTILQMFMSAYAPDSINKALGIYIPLIVVNCLILGRAESFAAKNCALGIEAYKNLEVATEAHCGALDSRTKIGTVCGVYIVDSKDALFALYLHFYGVGVFNLDIGRVHNLLDTSSKSLLRLFSDRLLCDIVYPSQYGSYYYSHAHEDENHIGK
jgi:Na+-translocating ferredoxin:NAD+ oxidoreductase RnfE subunit